MYNTIDQPDNPNIPITGVGSIGPLTPIMMNNFWWNKKDAGVNFWNPGQWTKPGFPIELGDYSDVQQVIYDSVMT